ncbi:MAG: tetratricopeptide repeat protein, partial [Planctomycetota bacterium]
MNKIFGRYRTIIVCAFLAFLTFLAYYRVLWSDFVNFDDTLYVTENRHVQEGLTGESVRWAFISTDVSYWQPVAWLSHMLDCELFGLVNSLLVLVVLKRFTGAFWASVFVAGLFALHPFNVDSVAWIAERKNVLSTTFWLLTIWAYGGYARRGGILLYLGSILLFVLGLLAKPMLVTLPFVLVLLDYWPLR